MAAALPHRDLEAAVFEVVRHAFLRLQFSGLVMRPGRAPWSSTATAAR
jgi:hypothetical protein